jgi:uracil-DNA glycosylase family 4
MTKTDNLRKILDEVWNLKSSPLYEYRTKNSYYPVLGEGNHDAAIIFVGEAPGENEAKQGRPFVGAAGRVLTVLIESIKLKREDVYITNIVKDRPPGNRDPSPEEIKLYAPFLVRQIEIIKPKVIATLGRFSMTFILQTLNMPEQTQTITRLHGRTLYGHMEYGDVTIVPLFHPAVALYNPATKKSLEEDFQVLKNFL